VSGAAAYTAALMAEGDAPPMRPLTERDHPNALRLKAAHDAFKAGDLDALFGMMVDDFAWVMPGKNVLAGRFVGREAILASFGALKANVDAYWAHPLDYFGSDDHVVLVAQVVARRGAKRLDCRECLLWAVGPDGRFTSVHHMALDEDAWDRFFDGSPG
jgi:ketosteroid isomerase-like protein